MNLPNTEPKQIYAMLSDNGKVKIGVSHDVSQRMETIEKTTGLKIVKIYSTCKIDRNAAFKLETVIREKLNEFLDEENGGREWFRISFKDAIDVINKVMDENDFKTLTKETSYKYKVLLGKMVEKNINYDVLAKIIEMTENSLRKSLVSGERELRLSEAIKIRNILAPDMTIDELFKTGTNRKTEDEA